MKINFVLAVIVTIAYIMLVSSHPLVMQNIMVHFVKPLVICQKEMQLPDNVYNDFNNFWTEGYEITNNATGCALICMAANFKLILGGPHSHIDLKTCLQYIKKRGADDATAERILFHLRQCEDMSLEEKDTCMRVVRSANCFRKEIQALNWAPRLAQNL